MNDQGPFIDEEKIVALTQAVLFWSAVAQNPKATPPTEGKLIETADKLYHWLTS